MTDGMAPVITLRLSKQGIIYCVLGCAIALAASRILSASFEVPSPINAILIMNILCVVAFGMGLHDKALAGAVVLDFGHCPSRKMFLLGSVFWMFIALPGIFKGISGGFAPSNLAHTAFYVFLPASFLLTSRGRFQIRENGIWNCMCLLKWKSVEWYAWDELYDDTLSVQVKSTFSSGQIRMHVPDERRSVVEELLQENCLDKLQIDLSANPCIKRN